MNATQNQKKLYVIVVGIDYSELGDLALERACEFAKAHERTELHVVHRNHHGGQTIQFPGRSPRD